MSPRTVFRPTLHLSFRMADDLFNDPATRKLSADSKVVISLLKAEFRKFKDETLHAEFSKFKEEMATLINGKNEIIEQLSSKLSTLEKHVSTLKEIIDDQEAYTRRETVVLAGPSIPEVSNGEKCGEIAINLIKSKLNLNLTPDAISTAHRLGKKPISQGPDKRKIVVKFTRRDLKRDVVSASRKQVKPAQLFVSESLTPARSTLFFALRKMRSAHPEIVKGCTTFEGKVFAFTKPSNPSVYARDQRHFINSYDKLVSFCRDFIKVPMENFLASWNH